MSKGVEESDASLIDKAGVTGSLEMAPSTESAWIEVIHKMDSVYADLLRYQVELEQKNSALEEAQQQPVQSEKMASLVRLVAGVAHELNNPIRFVFGNTHALKRYGLRITEYLSEVDSQTCSENPQV